MAAAQCRSSKCTAERKGFRRELDSWRHKLIHCIGFESILEGIYGPLLLRDLNIFDDCEPEEVDDWSAEASCSHCSFCNLPLDKICDHIPAAASPLSSPSDYSPSQAPPLSDSSQSAHRFLQAVFHKKGLLVHPPSESGISDVPVTCDANIPLVAQELMKKMIHQFAIEYASKSKPHVSRNGLTPGSSSPLSDAADPDAPLDLTVSRSQETIPQPDGVLDLSTRNSACSTTSSAANHKSSGLLSPTIAEDLEDPGRQSPHSAQAPTLEAVFSALCPAHRSLLYQILKLAYQEGLLSLPQHRPTSRTDSHCCHRGVAPPANSTQYPFPFNNCKAQSSSPHCPLNDHDHQGHSGAHHPTDSNSSRRICQYPFRGCKSPVPQASTCCCLQTCRVAAYTVCCLKNLSYISCQSVDVEHINRSNASSPSLSSGSMCSTSSCLCPSSSLCPASSICCSHHNPRPCPCYADHACLTQVSHKMEEDDGDGDLLCPGVKREPPRSPSPPPLSPIHSDTNSKTEEKPPYLLHHGDDEGDDLTLAVKAQDGFDGEGQQGAEAESKHEKMKEGRRSRAVLNPSGSLLQDVVDRFSERLETIRPLEKDLQQSTTANQSLEKKPPLASSASQSAQSHDDDHFSEIITKVLRTGCDSDYNLNELFHRHDNNEAKSPNTRSRRRQEVLAAMTASPDSTSTRRNSLKKKRELALFDLSYCRRRLSLTKRGRLKDGKLVISPTSSSSSETAPVKEKSDREIEIRGMKGVCEIQEIVAVREESQVETVKTGDDRDTNDREIECVTTVVQEDKISEVPERGNPREDGEMSQDEEITLTAYEGHKNEVKEEIETVIVTEEIENGRIKLEKMSHRAATEEENQGTPVSTTELKSFIPGAKERALGYNGAWNKEGSTRQTGSKMSQEEVPCGQTCDSPLTKGKGHPRNVRGRKKASFPCQPCSSRETGRSRRNINPPQRFASYVTEPRKMYFAACFSESIFSHRTAKDKISKASHLDTFTVNPDGNNTHLESKETLKVTAELQTEPALESTPKEQFETSNVKVKDQSQVIVATTERSLSKHSSQNKMNGKDGTNRPYGRLRSSMSKQHNLEIESAPRKTPKRSNSSNFSSSSATCGQSRSNFQTAYTSPIKLMYVSPVIDKEGVKYSLKSAVSGSSGQGEETFDPCEESSWAGTPTNSPCNDDATSPRNPVPSPRKCSATSLKNPSTPPKSSTSLIKSASMPSKSSSTPLKSASSSPRSTSSSPKVGPKRSGESTPTKRGTGTENQRSPGSMKGVSEKQNESVSFHETTPPKRRPGRPKKLGPQLEKKVKRPIGRPRKQKDGDVKGAKAENVKAVVGSDTEEKANKNLKITVVYGRSRRNKRLVSVGCGQLQTEVHGLRQSGDRNCDLSIILHNSQSISGSVKATSSKWSEELHFVRPVKDRETPLHSSSNIKCQKLKGAVALRKPGRPAKVKISGISVTVTTVSPRQRKIQINKDAKLSPKTLNHKKALLSDNKSAKEPTTISVQSNNDSCQTEETIEVKEEDQSKHPDRPVAVRHSVRVRKPSVYLLHSVATSRSYSHSTALLRRSRKLLLNKASNQRRQEEAHGEVEVAEGKRQVLGQGRKQMCHNLSRVAGVSVDSIFPPGETLRWWAPSAEEDTLNQELARRIRLVSDTWVSDNTENQGKMAFKPTLRVKGNHSCNKRSRHSSVVRMLFDCPPRKPRTCSMQQLSSWFMQTTETQSLAIVKKSSSRNPYELMHYPRSSSKGNICHSPQAERLRKHIKKFAKIVPKSPSQHQQAQDRLWDRKKALSNTTKRQLFTPRFPLGRLNEGVPWWRGRTLGKYSNALLRAKARFLTRKERRRWPGKQRNNQRPSLRWRLSVSSSPGHLTAHQLRDKAFSKSATDGPYNCLKNSCTTSPADLTQAPMEVPKEQRLSSKAWSPETLKECRVFLKKINSPVNESTAEDSCTVTLDDESSSALRLVGREKELERDVKAVKTRRKKRKKRRKKRTAYKLEPENSPSEASQNQDGAQLERREGKCESPAGVSSEPPHPPPAKMLRQSRVRGLTGPRWCDFVVGN